MAHNPHHYWHAYCRSVDEHVYILADSVDRDAGRYSAHLPFDRVSGCIHGSSTSSHAGVCLSTHAKRLGLGDFPRMEYRSAYSCLGVCWCVHTEYLEQVKTES